MVCRLHPVIIAQRSTENDADDTLEIVDQHLVPGQRTGDFKEVYPRNHKELTGIEPQESAHDNGGMLRFISTIATVCCLHRRISLSVGT